ncbi:MAG: cytochrome-c peroxidase [Gammaproteobacteria bacterium]|nr:cytochrome-c peroxidase [Gammaproteobacteria bacterium]
MKNILLFIIVIFSSSLAAANDKDLNTALYQLIAKHKLTGKPLLKKESISINSPMAQLGKRLFFSTHLGGKSDSACVSCHHPLLGGGDNLPLSVGVDAIDPKIIGPGRKHSPKGFDFDGGPTVPRNSPTTFNTVFYSRCMFWDCRIESLGATPGMNGDDNSIMRTPDTMWGMPRIRASSLLQAQVAFPVTSENEMRAKFMEDEDNNELRETLAKRLIAEEDKWLKDFRLAFNSKLAASKLINFENISIVIAAYEESQIFINNSWNAFIDGDEHAMTTDAKRGALLFFRNPNEGGYGCAQCHTGDFFTDENFHVLAIPQIGRGVDDGIYEDNDYGRFVQTGNPDDKFAFRTPTLLNVEVTGPYGHSGAYKDLRSIIRHMINPDTAINNYDFNLNQLDTSIQKSHARENSFKALAHLQKLQTDKKSKITPAEIKERDVDGLYAFLLSLTDPCVKDTACMKDWLE